MVEHHLAKVDVASSSLVTRSSLRLCICGAEQPKCTGLKAHRRTLLQAHAHGHLVLVQRPGRKRLEVEIACASRRDSCALVKKFGGRIEALPRNWLKQFAQADSKPIKIGKRLMVVRSINELEHCSVRCPQRSSHSGARPHALRTAHPTAHTIKPALLAIPASLAFGTGEHATTAMSLRLLEELTRRWERGWSLVDVGTGTGILALAAKYFGAGRVIGMDNDPAAISVAKSNARLNKIRDVSFQLGDVHKWHPAQKSDVITANLYSDLLLEILPKLARRQVANSLRHIAQPTRRIGSRTATEPLRHHQCEASREMGGHSDQAKGYCAPAGG